jgi:hypothetical protein
VKRSKASSRIAARMIAFARYRHYGTHSGRCCRVARVSARAGSRDPPPLKWSDLRYVFDIKEDCNGKEAIQA